MVGKPQEYPTHPPRGSDVSRDSYLCALASRLTSLPQGFASGRNPARNKKRAPEGARQGFSDMLT